MNSGIRRPPLIEVEIEVRPRIHLGLLSMHDGAPRMNGGIGFAVDNPQARITVRQATKLAIIDERARPMACYESAQLTQAIERFARSRNLTGRAEIRISGDMRTHVGMGSATALRLGALEAVALLNGVRAEPDELVIASGRGGTSGVGINSYFSGGLICDLGRANDNQMFVPSSAVPSATRPLAFPAVSLPTWPLLLCLPTVIASKTQAEEADFFARTTPLPQPASFEACYVALFQIYAAAVEKDYDGFCEGIQRMQRTTWKLAERSEYGQPLEHIANALADEGADCVGMSSLGPMLFCFAPAMRLSRIREAAMKLGCEVFESSPANSGRTVGVMNA